jgi:hypothetical protein
MKKNILLVLCLSLSAYGLQAQSKDSSQTSVPSSDNLMDMLNDMPPATTSNPAVGKKPKKEMVYNTFGGTHLINGQTTETINKKTMAFIISHRFGALRPDDGNWKDFWRNFFGLDQASMRMSFEYGILDNLTIGASRSTFEKTFDFYTKYRFVDQKKKGMPFSMALYADMAINSMKWVDQNRHNYISSRMSYAFQLIMARKFNEYFSFQLSPTVTHYNLVATSADPNTVFSLGAGFKVKASKRLSFLAEYYRNINDNKNNGYQKDIFAIGMDVVTGGHVFQFQFTNAQAMFESGFLRRTSGSFWKGDVHIGFNISRTWGVGKDAKAERKEKRAKKKAAAAQKG